MLIHEGNGMKCGRYLVLTLFRMFPFIFVKNAREWKNCYMYVFKNLRSWQRVK